MDLKMWTNYSIKIYKYPPHKNQQTILNFNRSHFTLIYVIFSFFVLTVSKFTKSLYYGKVLGVLPLSFIKAETLISFLRVCIISRVAIWMMVWKYRSILLQFLISVNKNSPTVDLSYHVFDMGFYPHTLPSSLQCLHHQKPFHQRALAHIDVQSPTGHHHLPPLPHYSLQEIQTVWFSHHGKYIQWLSLKMIAMNNKLSNQ